MPLYSYDDEHTSSFLLCDACGKVMTCAGEVEETIFRKLGVTSVASLLGNSNDLIRDAIALGWVEKGGQWGCTTCHQRGYASHAGSAFPDENEERSGIRTVTPASGRPSAAPP